MHMHMLACRTAPDKLNVLLAAEVELHIPGHSAACQRGGALLLQLLHRACHLAAHDGAAHRLAQREC